MRYGKSVKCQKKENKNIGVVHAKSNICFVTNDQKREFLFFGHFAKNKYLILTKVQNKEIPFFGHLVKQKYLFLEKLPKKRNSLF